MKKLCIVFVCLVWGSLMFSQELLITDYIDDLYSYAAIGYKSKAEKRYSQQGSILYTDNKNDFAITGKGFFKLINPHTGDILYTRNGRFIRDENNNYYSLTGYKVSYENNNFQIYIFSDEDAPSFCDGTYLKSKFMKICKDAVIINNALELSNVYPLETMRKLESLLEQYRLNQELSDYLISLVLNELKILKKMYTEFENSNKTEDLYNYLFRLETDKALFYSLNEWKMKKH